MKVVYNTQMVLVLNKVIILLRHKENYRCFKIVKVGTRLNGKKSVVTVFYQC